MCDKKQKEQSDIGAVSGSSCMLCNGSGLEERDYFNENNPDEIITIEEKCTCCNGSGNENENYDNLRGELIGIVWWMENKFTQTERDKCKSIGDIVNSYLNSEHYHPSSPLF